MADLTVDAAITRATVNIERKIRISVEAALANMNQQITEAVGGAIAGMLEPGGPVQQKIDASVLDMLNQLDDRLWGP